MTPYYQDGAVTLWHGDSLVIMPTLSAASIDAIVTDPPYGLGFMGKAWDHGVPGVPFWIEALRVAKPGAHLLAFGGTRTFHRLAVAIEDAGWEIRDCIFWCFGSGFPKSKNIGCKCGGCALQYSHEKETVDSGQLRDVRQEGGMVCQKCGGLINRVGYGSALKPAFEPIIMARKPLCGTLLQNVLKYGTGAINVDGCRVEGDGPSPATERRKHAAPNKSISAGGWVTPARPKEYNEQRAGEQLGRFPANLIHDGSAEVVGLFPESETKRLEKPSDCSVNGSTSFGCMRGNRPARGYDGSGSAARFFKECKFGGDDLCEVANTAGSNSSPRKPRDDFAQSGAQISDSHAESAKQTAQLRAILDSIGSCKECIQSLTLAKDAGVPESIAIIQTIQSHLKSHGCVPPVTGESINSESCVAEESILSGGKRFIYVPKASKSDRDEGCEGLEHRLAGDVTGGRVEGSAGLDCPRAGAGRTSGSRNHHPTVKPTALMRYLCRLVTPPNGIVLDPFMGSGSTGKGAVLEGFGFIGIDKELEYAEISRLRIARSASMAQEVLPLEAP